MDWKSTRNRNPFLAYFELSTYLTNVIKLLSDWPSILGANFNVDLMQSSSKTVCKSSCVLLISYWYSIYLSWNLQHIYSASKWMQTAFTRWICRMQQLHNPVSCQKIFSSKSSKSGFIIFLFFFLSLSCLDIVTLLYGLVWFLCLMAYQSSWVIQYQRHSWRRTSGRITGIIPFYKDIGLKVNTTK